MQNAISFFFFLGGTLLWACVTTQPSSLQAVPEQKGLGVFWLLLLCFGFLYCRTKGPSRRQREDTLPRQAGWGGAGAWITGPVAPDLEAAEVGTGLPATRTCRPGRRPRRAPSPEAESGRRRQQGPGWSRGGEPAAWGPQPAPTTRRPRPLAYRPRCPASAGTCWGSLHSLPGSGSAGPRPPTPAPWWGWDGGKGRSQNRPAQLRAATRAANDSPSGAGPPPRRARDPACAQARRHIGDPELRAPACSLTISWPPRLGPRPGAEAGSGRTERPAWK